MLYVEMLLAVIFTMRIFILIIILSFSVQTFSQNVNFDKVDDYVENLQTNNAIDIDQLTTLLTKPFSNDLDKVRAIYYWLAKNIEYDYVGFETHFWDKYASHQELLSDTYKFKKGICSGYSHLFKYMLGRSNIECEVIEGYSRGDLRNLIVQEPDHAWNAVKINDKWNLIDVTWSRDTLNITIDDFWFVTSPDLFVFSHYPIDPIWTLLKTNISLSDFKNRPLYSAACIKLGIVKSYSNKGHYTMTNNQVAINLLIKEDYIMLTYLYDLEKGDWFSPIKVEDKTTDKGYLKILVDRKGKFILKLDAGKNSDGGFSIDKDLIYYIIENK